MNVNDFEINCELKSAFFENAYSPFVILDRDMNFVDVNQASVDTIGIEKENFIGKNMLDIFPYLEGTERYDAYKNVIDTGVPLGYDELLFKGEFTDLTFMSRAFKIGDYLGITTLDITNVIDTVQKLKSTKTSLIEVNENLKKKNQELEDFSYVAAHDLRAPLTNLKSLLRMALETNISANEVMPIVEKMNVVTKVMCDKITALNMVIATKSNFGAPKIEIEFSEVVSKLKASYSKEIIECRTIIKEDYSACPSINYNKLQLETVLQTLMSNALKYRHPKRKLSIKIETKEVNGKVQLSFKDNGLGFDQEFSDKIFALLKRLHTHVDGLGVALYIMKIIISENDGAIDVKSQVNKGTEFIVIF
ncbi:PAS domain-containing sensor histidine kinase [uncultured Maribacter sp.]|uniref:sensor histidine kinase n=1 Tax=uncultured Maribacter sp. TaxID=431308 RepID=UPI002634F368|nr:PAS domain-containing sensor histidine kinase [uncultured Maribacter sp.]